MRHVAVMACTGAIGLVAVFAVDLLNLFYLSLLGQRAVAAAVGFAGAVGFLQISICIGMTIGTAAVVSRAVGAGLRGRARRLGASSLVLSGAIAIVLGVGTDLLLGPLLDLLGASGETRQLAHGFVMIVSPSLPLVAVGMVQSALLRSVGEARAAMDITLLAAVAAAALDPLFIFALHLGLTGAAISTVLSRCVLAAAGWHLAVRRHRLVARPRLRATVADSRHILSVAAPAVLTNLATPVSSVYVTRMMAHFGAEPIAGQATIDRLVPVAFGLVFALTGAVGPILAQNLGAGRLDRVREGLRDSLLFMVAAVGGAWVLLAATQDLVVLAFSVHGIAAVLVRLFCTWLAGEFLFLGALFVANAAFNNLGFPLLSTLFNWGRATLGTVPFVAFGARFGPQGVAIGQAAGCVIFGIAAVVTAFHVVGRLKVPGQPGAPAPVEPGADALPTATARGALATMLTRPRRARFTRPRLGR